MTPTTAERIEKWIEEQFEKGRTRDELHNTHFVLTNDSVATLKKRGKKGFQLDIALPPYTVDFTEGNVMISPTRHDNLLFREKQIQQINALADRLEKGEIDGLAFSEGVSNIL